MENKFFTSKLNTVLLSVLIILVLGIGFFVLNKDSNKYEAPKENSQYSESEDPIIKNTYTYTNHGFSIELPKGFVPKEIKGETLPTISIELPNKSYLIYITNADLWFKNNIEGQGTYLRDEKVGLTLFKIYKYNGQDFELYIFRQGNIAYSFGEDSIEYMKTFKFLGWSQEKKYSKDGISFDYSKDVTLNSFVNPGGYTVVELKKKNSQSLVSIHYAKSATDGARNMFSCFEFPVIEVVAGGNKFRRCSSNAEPSDIYVLSSDSVVINIITNNFEGGIKIDDFIDLSSIRLN